jgi:cation diffusion facilitator CzcD-associated flavoprotein CzcO
VVGAGCSGLTAVKALREAGLPHQCFELGDRVGGNWVFGNKTGRSGAYRSLHINTSRTQMEFRDFPMPSHLPDFPHHRHVAEYFESYARKFALYDSITFETEVVSCVPRGSGSFRTWNVTVKHLAKGGQEATHEFDAIVVANGHHWQPALPAPPPGSFDGEVFHSHSYVDPETPVDLRGKHVVIVGMGNSAMDIACEVCRPGIAERLYLSARRGAWVIPKYVRGKPVDQGSSFVPSFLPDKTRRWLVTRAFQLLFGRMQDYGLPEPDHLLGEAHPTLSSELPSLVGSGDILPRPAISRLDGDGVVFSDGRRERADVIIWCTGYRVSFPFFERELVSAPDNSLPLFHRLFDPRHPDIAFVGLAQPLGAIMPIADEQSRFIAEYFAGRYALPPADEMRAAIERDEVRSRKRFVASPRHTMQIDPEKYLNGLARELARGKRRARAGHGAGFRAVSSK